MRDIKFRAWGLNSKEFLQDSKGYGLTLKEIQNIHDLDVWELTQYTGLKDKSGKEIYEGDILVVDWGGIKDEYIINNKYDKPFVMEWRGYEYPPFSRYLPTPQSIEVIGNIYENGELINQPD